MKKEGKKKKSLRPKHPRNGGESRFTIWIAFTDAPKESRLSIPFPNDYLRELCLLKERYRKFWKAATVRAAHIYDNHSGELLEYLDLNRQWREKKPKPKHAFKIIILPKGEGEKKLIYSSSEESLHQQMSEIEHNEIFTYASNIYVYQISSNSMIYYWNFRHGAFDVPYEKNKVVVPLVRSKFRIFLIDAQDQKETIYSTETDVELAFQQILQKLDETDYSSYRVVQVYEQMENSLLYHAKYGHKVLDVLEAYQNAILSQ